MRVLRRSKRAVRLVVCGICTTFFLVFCGPSQLATGEVLRGSKTSDGAAGGTVTGGERVSVTLAGWRPTTDFVASAAAGDTTDIGFPVEEEETREHLYRDIGIFLVVSAFVGYFIIKVFLEGDTEDPPPPKKGKQIPGS